MTPNSRIFKAILIGLPLVSSFELSPLFGNPGTAENNSDSTPPPVAFALSKTEAVPGSEALVLLSVATKVPLNGISMDIDFDETKLRLLGIRRVFPDAGTAGPPKSIVQTADYQALSFNNLDREEKDQLHEGWISVDLNSMAEDVSLWIDQNVILQILELRFLVLPDAPEGFTPVRFEKIQLGDVRLSFSNAIQDGGITILPGEPEAISEIPVGCAEPVPAEPTITFSLTSEKARPGETATLLLTANTDVELTSLSVAVNFDESRLRLLNVRRIFSTTGSPEPYDPADIAGATFTNLDEKSGNQSDEGWLAVELSSMAEDMALDVGRGDEIPLLALEFLVLPGAPPGFSPVSFETVGPKEDIPGALHSNEVGLACPPPGDSYTLPSGSTNDGGIDIIGEVGFFMRGDSDFSLEHDISDPITSLHFLFLGGVDLQCYDAADADDNGALEVTDVIRTLTVLYEGGETFPPPDQCGPDPTDDDPLDCKLLNGCQ